jgi:hypothetical protein
VTRSWPAVPVTSQTLLTEGIWLTHAIAGPLSVDKGAGPGKHMQGGVTRASYGPLGGKLSGQCGRSWLAGAGWGSLGRIHASTMEATLPYLSQESASSGLADVR